MTIDVGTIGHANIIRTPEFCAWSIGQRFEVTISIGAYKFTTFSRLAWGGAFAFTQPIVGEAQDLIAWAERLHQRWIKGIGLANALEKKD